MSYAATCTYCYRPYTNRRHRGTYCLRCRVRTWPRRTRARLQALYYDYARGARWAR